jgi:hypothetical protein
MKTEIEQISETSDTNKIVHFLKHDVKVYGGGVGKSPPPRYPLYRRLTGLQIRCRP